MRLSRCPEHPTFLITEALVISCSILVESTALHNVSNRKDIHGRMTTGSRVLLKPPEIAFSAIIYAQYCPVKKGQYT